MLFRDSGFNEVLTISCHLKSLFPVLSNDYGAIDILPPLIVDDIKFHSLLICMVFTFRPLFNEAQPLRDLRYYGFASVVYVGCV